MQPHEQFHPVVIPANVIQDPASFEALRLGAYRAGDTAQLTALAESTDLVADAGASLYDIAIEQALSQDGREPSPVPTLKAGQQVVQYEVQLADDGEVTGIVRHEISEPSQAKVAAASRRAARVPWGPETNGASMHVGGRSRPQKGRGPVYPPRRRPVV